MVNLMQGSYTADGNVKLLEVPFDANWLKVVNFTVSAAGGAGSISECYWQQGMDYGLGYTKLAADDSLEVGNLAAATGITKINTGDNPLTAAIATTGVTGANPPLITLADTTGFVAGSIVRMGAAPAATQLDGMDFSVGTVVGNTSLELPYMAQIVADGNAGEIYRVKYDKLWYPRTRFISAMTQAAQALITLTVTHEYAVGDYVRLMVPDAFGMKEANLKEVKVTAIDAANNTITVNLDTTAYTAFAFPVTGTTLTSWAEVVPLSGPIENVQFRGFELPAGAAAAGGVANDVIYWAAGDSFGI